MKTLKSIFGVCLGLTLATGCLIQTSYTHASASASISDEVGSLADFDFRKLPSGVFKPNDLRESFDTIGYVSGKFTATGNDTIYCIALGCSYYKEPEELDEYDVGYNCIDNYMLSSKSLYIPELYLSIPFLNDIQTVDLDCDGIEELVVYHGGYTSYWNRFEAYSLKDGQWYTLNPVAVNIAHRQDNPNTPAYEVACDQHPGSMIIYEDKFLLEDPTEIETVKRLVKIEPQPFIVPTTTCYTLPAGVAVTFPF